MQFFGTTRTGAALHGEHQATLGALNDLDVLIRGPLPDLAKADVAARLAAFARTMDEDVTSHFAFEEEHLFPVLDKAGAGHMVAMLLGEHELIRPLAIESRRLALAALEAGAFERDAWITFKEVAAELVEREIFHVQKEEMGLLAALAQVLDADQDAALAEAHASR